MNAAEIAVALGAAHHSGQWWRCLCPVHGSRTGRSATLALRDGDHGLLIRCWAGCDPRNVLAELRRFGLCGEQGKYGSPSARLIRAAMSRYKPPPPAPVVRIDETARRIEIARRIWGAACEARGTPVERYLTGRGITLSVPPSLRFAPALRRPHGTTGPAMVARIDGPDGELIGVHRTWLDRDAAGVWWRGDRAMLGRAAGDAVRLAPAGKMLAVGEGIESCLAAVQATGMLAWAALSTSGLVALTLPPIVRDVVVLADHDISGAGERAARSAAARWLAEGRRVRIALPPEPGTDFNDVLVGCAGACIIEARHVAP